MPTIVEPAPQIVHLMDVSEARPLLVRWFIEAWRPWYGPDGEGDAEADLAACIDRDRLPLCLVAIDNDGRPLGTAGLKAESLGSELGTGPWLAAFLVDEAERGRGIGRALIEAIAAEARRLGHKALYTATELPPERLWPRGWQAIGGSESLRGAVTVYRLTL